MRISRVRISREGASKVRGSWARTSRRRVPVPRSRHVLPPAPLATAPLATAPLAIVVLPAIVLPAIALAMTLLAGVLAVLGGQRVVAIDRGGDLVYPAVDSLPDGPKGTNGTRRVLFGPGSPRLVRPRGDLIARITHAVSVSL